MRGAADHPAAPWVLAALALALGVIGARSQPGGINDGSRLATSESLVDRGTLAIDDSVFVHPPPEQIARLPLPDEPDLPYSLRDGTLDRLRIGGHFYSDKPMVPAVLTAAAYRALMALGWPRPGERPDVFCRACTVLNCGLGYAAAVGFMWVLGRRVELSPGWRMVWLVGFALATVLPAYTRNLNAGIPQLAAVAGLAVCLSRIAEAGARTPWWSLAWAGTCVGFAYTIDQASGAPLVLAAAVAVAVRTRRTLAVAAFLLASLPWAAAHHAINYAIGGVWLVPLNMVPEYLDWPGSIFDTSNMTGVVRHTPLGLVAYTWLLLFGRVGFVVCNPPLFLALAFGWRVLARSLPDRVELAALAGWCVAVVGVYAVLSDNYGGTCLSVRWFVPLLVPAFWVLARLLVAFPHCRPDFAVLTLGGLVASAMMWPCGPWQTRPDPPVNWVVGFTVAAWVAVRVARKRDAASGEER